MQSCPGRKKHYYLQCKSHQALKTPSKGPSKSQHWGSSATQEPHKLAQHTAGFIWLWFCFQNILGSEIFNCCYYSSLDWSRFLILEKYLSHSLLSTAREKQQLWYILLSLFSFFRSCTGYSSFLLCHTLLTRDPHKAPTLSQRSPLRKRSGREERCLHEYLF